MAFDTGISNAVQQYVYTQSGGDVTDAVNESWIQAYCEYLGATTLIGNSWLITLCNHFGITEPLNGSWTIALANYYGITTPYPYGTWWMAIAFEALAPITELIWNETTTDWNLTDVNWATDTIAPDAPVWSGQTFPEGVYTPTITGTAEPFSTITLTADAQIYTGQTDALGDWSVQITNPLAGDLSPGISYLVSVTATDAAGNVSPATDDYIYIVAPDEVVITLDMFDSYGDGWNKAYFQLEKETAPNVWTPVEFNGNPFRFATGAQFLNFKNSGDMTGAQYYKTDSVDFLETGIYGLRFETNEPYVEPAWTTYTSTGFRNAIGLRSWNLSPGNYRTVSMSAGQYPSEISYTIRNGATEIVSVGNGSTVWQPGNVQSTFTIS